MRRDLAELTRRAFDLAIIGGGIVGAWIACDAARRGLKVALVDKGDFGAATSAASSKLAHGGLRYLARGDWRAAREGLRERAILRHIAPDAIAPLRFWLPVSGRYTPTRVGTSLVLALYDRLGGHTDGFAPARYLSPSACAALEPTVAGAYPGGAVTYEDGLITWPERLVLRILADAAHHGACLANHVETVGLKTETGGFRLALKDHVSGSTIELTARTAVNAAGPWADRIAGLESGPITRSKGIHVIVPSTGLFHALAAKRGGEHVFALPWQGHVLIGTTDTAYTDDPDAVTATPQECRELLAKTERLLPGLVAPGTPILHAYAGLRPLSGEVSATYRASRRAQLVDHGGPGRPGLLSAVGGKWTTARHLAEQVVDHVGCQLDRRLAPASTATRPLAPLAGPFNGSVAARVAQAVREEMAVTLDDIIERRWRPDSFALDASTRAAIREAFHATAKVAPFEPTPSATLSPS
jgi:glycerol-3-phosphate dehydrogenase